MEGKHLNYLTLKVIHVMFTHCPLASNSPNLIVKESGNIGKHMDYLMETNCLCFTYYPSSEKLEIQDEGLYPCRTGNKKNVTPFLKYSVNLISKFFTRHLSLGILLLSFPESPLSFPFYMVSGSSAFSPTPCSGARVLPLY